MRAFEKAVALTGGIGTGKSSASAILSLYGFRVIDADKVAHEVLESKSSQIAEAFGAEYISDDGKVNRKALGALVFSDSIARKELEDIVHPAIYSDIERLSLEQERLNKPYIVDIPLFYERGVYPIDRVVTVYAPRELQIARVMKRDGISEEDAVRRIEAQMDIETKRARADWVIDNSGSLAQLQSECERVKDEILKSFE